MRLCSRWDQTVEYGMIELLVVVAAYLIGSLSFAVVASWAFGLPDPRTYGSGNPGATNVLRTGQEGGRPGDPAG